MAVAVGHFAQQDSHVGRVPSGPKAKRGNDRGAGFGVVVAALDEQYRRGSTYIAQNGDRRSARRSTGCSAANDRAAGSELPGRGDRRRDGQVEANGRAMAAGISPAVAGNY